jgi:hypothetical protein
MLDPLGDQRSPLATQPAAVLLFRRGSNHHRADPRLTPLVGQKRPQQRLAIQPVRLGPPAPARHRHRGRIHHVALDTLLLQNAVKPEPVQPRLLDRDDRMALARSRLRLALQLRKQLQEFRNITGLHAVLGHLLALPGDNDVTSQFERLSSNDTKIAPNCVRIAAGPSEG